MSWNFSCFLISPSSSSQRYVPWNVYWVDHLIIISNIIIACSANTANTPSHEASVSAIARTVGHHLMDAFSWLDHPWLGRPMRHKAIFHRNVCSNSGVFSLHKTYCTVTMFQSSLSSLSLVSQSSDQCLDTGECGAAGARPDSWELAWPRTAYFSKLWDPVFWIVIDKVMLLFSIFFLVYSKTWLVGLKTPSNLGNSKTNFLYYGGFHFTGQINLLNQSLFNKALKRTLTGWF